eukprot:CAMPEP_0171412690 /NCGR_PEP_ID=MMETSP0880-20121228/33144_1 /TAXON_ID=67004 /ORGANISM="Thalassiosira weissflogii, Strain CCMP1336" /LENGTH=45 /DNA_ID= /DNA_START= /DNA_END= /DNA_ORIENTATION=
MEGGHILLPIVQTVTDLPQSLSLEVNGESDIEIMVIVIPRVNESS